MSGPLTAGFSALYRQWFAEIGAADDAFFRQRLDAQWLYIDVMGAVRTKDEYLTYIGGISADGPTNALTSIAVRSIGPLALVNGTYDVDPAHAPSGAPSATTRFTAVWQRTRSGWVALAHQSTPVLPTAA